MCGMLTYQLALFLPRANCQDSETGQKYLMVAPLNGHRPVYLSADNIERGHTYPSIIQLKGNVEIKTPVCLPVGRHEKTVCDGAMILHASEAEFHEDTGEIEAHGDVKVTPLRHESAKK